MSAPRGLRERLLPRPRTTLVLAGLWLWLHDTVAAGHVLLGLALGFAIPLLTRRFAPAPRPVRVARLLPYLGLVLWDVIVANLQVAVQILGPVSRLRPGFVRVPLDLTTERAITVLASTITLTPGTVSCDLAPDRRTLVVHHLDAADPDALVAQIKQRYERRVKEIFEC